MKPKSNKMWRMFWLIFIFGVWHSVTISGKISPLLVPKVTDVISAILFDLSSGTLLVQILISTAFVACGMVLSAALGLLMAMLSQNRCVEGLIDTLCMLCHPLPAVAILPLIIIWFGAGYTSMLFIIIHAVLWPMLLNITSGIRSVPDIYIETALSLNLSRARIFFDIQMPSSMPYLFAGARIGWARAWRALISAEMIFGAIGNGGIGFYIFRNRVMMDTSRLYAGIFIVVIIGTCVEEGLKLFEKRTVGRWGMTRV